MFVQTGLAIRKLPPKEELLNTYGGFTKEQLATAAAALTGGNTSPGREEPIRRLSASGANSPAARRTSGGAGASPTPSVVDSTQKNDDRLPVGIVEYVAVIGPTSLPPIKFTETQAKSMAPSVTATPTMDSAHPHMDIDDSGEDDDDEDDRSYQGDEDDGFGDDGDDQEKVMDIQIYDRFPKQDYPKSPLPSKVEWFAFPEGSISVIAPERYSV